MAQKDDWDSFCDEFDDDYPSERIGCCDDCDQDLYEDDCYHIDGCELCGQCYWRRTRM